ncbi:MAG: acetyltransferase, partial [Deltaproteobacteria bacterium]|nr:acetyltransferase [Deltaproteobacteria bacterium]
VLIGAGGQGRELFDLLADLNAVAPRYEVLGWLVEPGFAARGTRVRERPVLGDLDWLAGRADAVQVICAVGAPEQRRRLVERARRHGATFCSAVHPQAVLTPTVTLEAGVLIAAGAVLTDAIRLGAHAIVNCGCTIAHDVVCEPFATLSPGVHVAGGAVLGEGCFLGTGASVVPRVRVGEWAVVGAGCAVVADVPPNTTVVGVPGRVITQRAAGWHLAAGA